MAEIKTANNRIDAKVKGSRYTSYKVDISVPQFTDSEKKKLIQAITDDPLLLSHLLNRELPHELNVIAEKHKIAVFPNKWSDFDMNCSCPDWAVPCKHLASVIYMLSAEIDRNPFLIFQLHGLDILKELTKVGMTLEEEMSISSFEQLFLDKPLAVLDENIISNNNFDLSKVTLQTENLLSLLEAKTVFYDKPLVSLLRKNYKAVSRHSKTLLNRDVVEFEPNVFERMEKVELFIGDDTSFYKVIFYSDKGDLIFEALDDGLDSLINFLTRLL